MSKTKIYLATNKGRWVKTLCEWITEKKYTTFDEHDVTCQRCIKKLLKDNK